MQSRRFYHALKGLGGTARLVMLPYESHGYRARESVLHMLWEQDRWLELQNELVGLSSNSRHIIAKESGHYIHHDQPDLVIDAIQELVEASM